MQKAAMAIVFGVALGLGGAWRVGGEGADARALRGMLAEKGVEGMYAECRENDWEMPAIRSAWAVSLMAGSGGSAQDTDEERERRALGFELAVALDVLSGEIIRETDPTALEAREGEGVGGGECGRGEGAAEVVGGEADVGGVEGGEGGG